MKLLLPLAVIAGALSVLLGVPLGGTLLLVAALVFPIGFFSVKDDRKIDKRDADMASFLRALGGVSKATGTTLTEALTRIDIRATGYLAPEVKRLHVRLLSGIDPQQCWHRFVEETGSELVHRAVQVFWDGVSKGGDPEEVGARAAFFASKIATLRAKRRLVSSTFSWVSIPMHAAITGLLIFIVDVMGRFSQAIQDTQPGGGGRRTRRLVSR